MSRHGSWIVALLAASVVTAGCNPFAGRSGSSIRTDNPWSGIDFVVRASTDEGVGYRAVAAGSDGLIQQSERLPVATTIAVLDPVSCRVISQIVLGPDAHLIVDIDTAGQVDAYPYDPADYGAWPKIGRSLPDSQHCAESDPDPRSTPAPTPAIVDGIRVEPGAIACQVAPAAAAVPKPTTAAFSVRVESVVGAVGGCRAHDDDLRPGPTVPSGVTVLNPDADLHRLAVAWDGTGCTVGATVSLSPTLAGYRADVISIDVPCNDHAARPFGVVVNVIDEVAAASVTADIRRVEEPAR